MSRKNCICFLIKIFVLFPIISFAAGANFEKVWEFELDTNNMTDTVQSQPKEFENLLFLVDGKGHLIALKKQTGAVVYKIKLGIGVGRRGFAIDESSGQIAIVAATTLFIVDARSGKVLKQRKITYSVAEPVFTPECIITFGAAFGLVQCHDRNLEEIFWETSLGKTARVWSNPLWSKKHNKLYLTTSNAGGLVGLNREPDTYSSSIIAINGSTGSIEFSRQMVKDDVWDFDGVGRPIFVEGFVNDDGAIYDLVIGLNKTGTIFVINAEDGLAIKHNQFREQLTPKGNGVNANLTQKQIIPSWPDRTNEIALPLSDLRADQVKFEALRHARYEEFLPPSLDYDVVTKGLHGGPEWHGGTYFKNGRQNLLAIPFNNTSWILRLQYNEDFWLYDKLVKPLNVISRVTKKIAGMYQDWLDSGEIAIADPDDKQSRWIQSTWSDSSWELDLKDKMYKFVKISAYNKKYSSTCAGCHRNDRAGRYQSELVGDGYVPSLVGYTLTEKYKYGGNYNKFLSIHSSDVKVTKEDLHGIFEHFDAYDKELLKDKKLSVNGFWQALLGKDSLPINKGPWGGVAIIDLDSGEKINDIVIGKMKDSDGNWIDSSIIFGGIGRVNSKGETLVVGTTDPKAYYISVPEGKVLQSFNLKRPGSVNPFLTELNGCEAWVVVETGGRFSFYDKSLNGYTIEMFINRSECGD